VRYRDAGEHEETADYCVCALPPHIASRIANNFSKETNSALQAARALNAGKMGVQFRRRFWEEDDRIFGGVTLTNMDITQILYPSEGYLGKKGVLIGYYAIAETANALGVMSPADRVARAVALGEKIHGAAYRAEFEVAFSADWRTTRFSEGAWVIWPGQASGGGPAFDRLQKPDGRVYFAGDHLSYAIGWQHGAFESARQVVMDLHKRVLTRS
jgi:monoamine oxidase